MAPYSAVDALNSMNAVIVPRAPITARRSIWVVLAIVITLIEIAALWGITAAVT